jgi:hypothetical protein
MPKPRLDLNRLRKDAAASGTRRTDLAPGGRPATGLMALVREHQEALVALQTGGLTWNAIAAALTAQGFTTADGRPLTGTHLTGLISSLRRQAARRSTREMARQGRADRPPAAGSPPARRLTLSTDLVPPPVAPAQDALAEGSEDAIRRESLARLQDLLKD